MVRTLLLLASFLAVQIRSEVQLGVKVDVVSELGVVNDFGNVEFAQRGLGDWRLYGPTGSTRAA